MIEPSFAALHDSMPLIELPRALEDYFAYAEIDPTRAGWTKSSWSKSSWSKSSWSQSSWTKSSWSADESGLATPWARVTWTCAACTSGDPG